MATRRKNGKPSGGTKPSNQQQEGSGKPLLRIAAGLGDPEREHSLLSALVGSGEIIIAERCLTADELLTAVQNGKLDAVLAAIDLHRLSDGRLRELMRTRVALVLLVFDVDDERWQSFPGIILPLDADADIVRGALHAATRSERPQPVWPRGEPEAQLVAASNTIHEPPTALSLLTVASGPGSPGRTTVAINLAAALGAVAPTVLVDADLAGPTVAAYLDLDPTRNLSMLAHAEPETPGEWDRAISQEIQPLGSRSRQAFVLCGVPKPEMRTSISARFLERVVAELCQRYRYVILDIGADLLTVEAELHRTALTLAQQVLLVTSADLVGLWRARTALGVIQNRLQLNSERVSIIVNRHDRRHSHSRTEIEWALSVPVAALVPYDHAALQRALRDQRPLVLDNRSRSARALLDLAERVHGGSLELPAEPAKSGSRRWLGRVSRAAWRRPGVAKTPEGA